MAPWHLGSHLNDFRSGSRNLQIHRGKSWPCMHPVWIGVDSGVPVRKLTRYHVTFMCSLAKGRFGSSPVRNFPLESIGIFRPLGFFRPTPRKNIWSNLVQSFFVRCQDLGIQVLTPVSRECTVSGLESILAIPSRSSCGIMWYLAKGRFWPSPCVFFHSRRFWPSPCEFFHSRQGAKAPRPKVSSDQPK